MDGRLAAKVEDWIAADPDAGDRAELRRLLAADDARALQDRFCGPLRFGTAGLRGPLRAGENGMNTAVVRRAAAGVAAWLAAHRTAATGPAADPGPAAEPDRTAGTGTGTGTGPGGRPLTAVIGFDARHRSESFALDTAGVFAAAGMRALVLPGPLPTPVLAFAVRHLDADVGVMVTASHNPATDNGYKVYLGGPAGDPGRGAQIVEPVDAEIEAAIRAVGPANGIPLAPGRPAPAAVPEVHDSATLAPAAGTWHRLDTKIVDAYITAALAAVPPVAPPVAPPIADDGQRTGGTGGTGNGGAPGAAVTVAYTPLHGVGADVLGELFARAGLRPPVVVDEQRRPDPDFPTTPFPNPEEPGTMDRVLALGKRVGADVVLAHDPDADRCAVAVGRRVLTGDEVGLLLADHVLRVHRGPVATTVVSSTALRTLAADAGVPYAETLTGFKWIMRADPGLVFGYEEALGYAVAPDIVRDKDGITAALAIALIAQAEKRRGRTLLDRLDDLTCRYGVFATAQVSLRCDDTARIEEIMGALRASPPAEIGGLPVTDIHDLASPAGHADPASPADPADPASPAVGARHAGRAGDELPHAGRLPPSNVLIFNLTGGGRVVVRPSGTEPKLKAYLEAVAPVGPVPPVGPANPADGLAAARAQAAERLDRIRSSFHTMIQASHT